MPIELNQQFLQALDIIENSKDHLFLTGKAGTGKSTLLKYFRQTTEKNHVVLAPTGVAAVNVYGETIHSFFKFKPGITPEEARKLGAQRKKDKLIERLETIIIDEISMVRADLLDCIHNFLVAATQQHKPFGNKQIVMIGDLLQLPPVVTQFEREIFQTVYESPYFFDAQIIKSITANNTTRIRYISLDKIYRQSDEKFIDILNSTRTKSLNQAHFHQLSRLIDPSFDGSYKEGYVTLVTTNKQADEINALNLEKIHGKRFKFKGTIYGQFEEKEFPTQQNLELVKNARVMFLNNDSEGRWINGTIGEVVGFAEAEDEYSNPIDIVKVKLQGGTTVEVWPYTWTKYQTAYNEESQKLQSREVGSYVQIPLKLAWAITIHKSQGKTFDKVVIDIGGGAFASGQIYVALSRCRTLEGIILKRPITTRDIIIDPRIQNFMASFNA